jgi:hypothetical protein
MSSEDIDMGARWSTEVASKLKGIKAGIICVTADNRNAPWLSMHHDIVNGNLYLWRQSF